jgi:hypothetical protein
MSAAATARTAPRAQVRAPQLTEEERKRKVQLQPGYSPVPNELDDVLVRKITAGAEERVIRMIARRTYGGKERLAFTKLPAEEVKSHLIISLEAVEQALRQAERDGFVESRVDRRIKHYALTNPKTWDKLMPDREPEAERKPVASAESHSSGQSAVKVEPVIVQPGKRSEVVTIGRDPHRFKANKQAVAYHVDVDPEGVIEICADPVEIGEAKENTLPIIRTSKTDAISELIESSDLPVMRQFLMRWAPRLPAPDGDTVSRAIKIQGSDPYPVLAGRLRTRLPKLKLLTWDLVLQSLPKAMEEAKEADGFQDFLALCTECKLPSSRVDIAIAEELWKDLALEDRLAAIAGLRARKDSEFLEMISDGISPPRPDRYLFKRAWERQVRPNKKSRAGDAIDKAFQLRKQGF